jgi:alpha-beta hydrolase superfamily lysophospholipase
MAEYTEIKDAFNSHDGVKIFYRKFQASDERARMVVAHGLGEHSGRYENVVSRLLPAGFTLWIPDHRGHGQSGGRKGHVLNFEQYLLDLRMLVEMAREDLPPGSKVFLLGHSMGGLIALYFALQSPELIDGVIASSPALGVAVEVPAVKSILGKIMSFIWPGLQLSNELDATKISRDESVVKAYLDDPLVHDRVSARWFTEILSTMAVVNGRASGLHVPVLMQVAGDDHLASAESSRRFFENLTVDDKTLYFYDDLYHEVYNELEDQRRKVLDDLEAWLEKHL